MESRFDCTWILGLPGFRVERIDGEKTEATKRPGFIPDVRFDLTGALGDGVATLNIHTQMQPAPPAGLQFGSPPYIYEIAATTTAGAISVCIDTTGMTFADRAHARLFFVDGGTWTDVTSNADPGNAVICGGLPAFGSVAIFTPTVSGSGAETLAGTGLSPDFTYNPVYVTPRFDPGTPRTGLVDPFARSVHPGFNSCTP